MSLASTCVLSGYTLRASLVRRVIVVPVSGECTRYQASVLTLYDEHYVVAHYLLVFSPSLP
jgi:hypothetical protein